MPESINGRGAQNKFAGNGRSALIGRPLFIRISYIDRRGMLYYNIIVSIKSFYHSLGGL